MTMLMLLALMTYGRLESFSGFAFVQAQFKEYMQKTERNYVNEEANKRYDKEVASKKEKNDSESESNPKNPASSTLSFNLFIDKNERIKHPNELEIQMNIAKNLMFFLYGDQPFFMEMEERRPDFMNEIFAALMRVTEEQTKKEKLNTKKVKEIATLDLGDLALNEVFTKMLKGSIEMVVEEMNPSNPEAQPLHPFKPARGYYSLLDFITLQKNKLQTRVYLASPQLLMAIYGNPEVVRQIIRVRNGIYYDLINTSPEGYNDAAKTAKEQFQSQFQNLQTPFIPATMLDFGVSKTDPRKYL
jgi:hypothetical protein